MPNRQLLFFFNRSKCDVDRVAKLMENYYKNRNLIAEFFQNRDVMSKEILSCLENQYYIMLPITPKNQMLFFHKIKNPDPSTYEFDSATKLFCMMLGELIIKWIIVVRLGTNQLTFDYI